MDVLYVSATELRTKLAAREVSAEELVRATLERIDEVNPVLNAVVARRDEAALAEAAAADRAASAGPLHGVPVTVKDFNETLDMPTTYGCRVLAGRQPGFEELVVTRLREAGAIIVGKTNTPEFGLRPTTENLLFGPTNNPWGPEHNSGGSSGGAAAAIAAGVGPIALGGDGGGSCRIPASCCGVVGMRPTRGRVPSAPKGYEAWAGLATNGPLGRTVRDAALMLDVIAGPVLGEPYGLPPASSPYLDACDRAPARLRLAVLEQPAHGALDREVAEAFRAAVAVLEGMGHGVEEADPGLGDLRGDFMRIIEGNTAAMLAQLVPEERLGELESSTLAMAARGLQATAADYCAAVDHSRLEAARIMGLWADHDYLVTPTLTRPAPRQGTMPAAEDYETRWRDYLDWLAFTYPFNITGQPSLSVPCGFTVGGLPIGLQIVGRTGDDAGVLALAAAFEAARPTSERRIPDLAVQAGA
jgi:amidase/aspartyl-tRNA(Asn)/glutamyl-tRNA(Gln) amidotransferase subunit A